MPHPKNGKNQRIGFTDAELYTECFEKKKIIKRNQVLKNSPDPENYWRGHQQSYNFFLVFVDFRTLPDNSGKPKSFDSKQKN